MELSVTSGFFRNEGRDATFNPPFFLFVPLPPIQSDCTDVTVTPVSLSSSSCHQKDPTLSSLDCVGKKKQKNNEPVSQQQTKKKAQRDENLRSGCELQHARHVYSARRQLEIRPTIRLRNTFPTRPCHHVLRRRRRRNCLQWRLWHNQFSNTWRAK